MLAAGHGRKEDEDGLSLPHPQSEDGSEQQGMAIPASWLGLIHAT